MTVKKFDRATALKVHAQFNEMLKTFASGIGAKSRLSGRFGTDHMKFSVEFTLIDADKGATSAVIHAAENLGISLEGANGRKLIDYSPRRHKYPWTWEQNGKQYKGNDNHVKLYFRKTPVAAAAIGI